MKAIQLTTYFSMAVLLGGCATPGPNDKQASKDGPSLASQYIYITERAAQQRMITVHWMNPPRSEDLKEKPEKDTPEEDKH